jgi:acyl-CoA thioesterase-1
MLLAVALVWGATSARAEPIRLVAFGDSLTAGLGLPANQAFPAKLEAALKTRGHDVLIENAGVSGDTASAGLARLDWSIPDGTQGVILELGANDALRGLDPAITEKALDDTLARLKARGIPVLLTGMQAPPNMGAAYKQRFDAIYPALAKKYGVPLYPFYLDGVAGDVKLNQADGIHPLAQGVDIIVARMLPAAEAFLAQIAAGKPG